MSLNPYSNGLLSEKALRKTANQVWSLNPYSNGLLSEWLICLSLNRLCVLILILMDYSLRIVWVIEKVIDGRLNPYSNGLLSEDIQYIFTYKILES